LEIQGVVLTMYDRRNSLSEHVARDVRGHFGETVYQTVIPRNVRVSEAPSFGKPALVYDLKCAGSQAYLKLAREVVLRERARRQHFSEAEIAELEASIRLSGVLQPILVRPSPQRPGEFEIVAGERRWRAAQRAGVGAIPALVRQLGDDRAYEIAIVENVQRED